jgi:NTP pyrophosphatase (non-canonical NTP hydrolase)
LASKHLEAIKTMTFDEYSIARAEFDKHTEFLGRHVPGAYPALGLAGEAGEVADKIKKLYRDHAGVATYEFREQLKKELGDVLWYLDDLASDFGFTLKDVARENIVKLKSRKERGVLGGSGDNR